MNAHQKKELREELNNINREVALDTTRIEIKRRIQELLSAEHRKLGAEITRLGQDMGCLGGLIENSRIRIDELEKKLSEE